MADYINLPMKETMLKPLSGVSDIPAGTLSVVMIDSADYAGDNTHEFLSEIPAAALVSDITAVGAFTITNGWFVPTADVTVSAVTGDTTEAIQFFFDTGATATSRLVCFRDTVTFTPNGSDATLDFDQTNGVFLL